MTVERLIYIFAGFFILLSLALGVSDSPVYMSKLWLWFTAFVGLNLFQSGFTKFCPLAFFLKKAGFRSEGGGC